MNEPTLTYTTTDGRVFDTHDAAKDWQATVNHVDAFLSATGVSDTARRSKRALILAFIDWNPPAEGGGQ